MIHLPYFCTPLFFLGCLVQPPCEGFLPCLILSFLVMSDCHLVEACTFLERGNRGVIDIREEGHDGELGGVKLWLGCIV